MRRTTRSRSTPGGTGGDSAKMARSLQGGSWLSWRWPSAQEQWTGLAQGQGPAPSTEVMPLGWGHQP